jgi:hypothetical protein
MPAKKSCKKGSRRSSKTHRCKKISGKRRSAKKMSGKPKSAKKSGPKTPATSANMFTENTRRKGRDGKMYKTKFTPSGNLKWVKCGAGNLCKGARAQGPLLQ